MDCWTIGFGLVVFWMGITLFLDVFYPDWTDDK